MSELQEQIKETKPRERKEYVQVKLSREILANADYSARLRRRYVSEILEEWLRWAWEDVDSQTGQLPETHPGSERSQQEIQANPKSIKQPVWWSTAK